MAPLTRPVLAGTALRDAVRSVMRRHLEPASCDVFLFGSEAEGRATPRSDIDVGVLGPAAMPGAVMQRLRDELEQLRTLRSFDLVDFSLVDERFRKEALRHAEHL